MVNLEKLEKTVLGGVFPSKREYNDPSNFM